MDLQIFSLFVSLLTCLWVVPALAVGSSFGSTPDSIWCASFTFEYSLLFYNQRCSRPTMSFLCPNPGINYFFKEPSFIYWKMVTETKIRAPVFFILCVVASRTSQWGELRTTHALTFTHTYLSTYLPTYKKIHVRIDASNFNLIPQSVFIYL